MALTRLPISTTALFVNPGDADSVKEHIFSATGLSLELGKIARLNQATTNPANFLEDKQKLINAIVRGVNGESGRFITGGNANNESDLHLQLPNKTDNAHLPSMTSLVAEYTNIYNGLVGQGITTDIAKLSADNHIRILLGSRLAQYSLSFPGLVDDAFTAGQNLVQQTHNTNAKGVGLSLEGQTQHVHKKSKIIKHRTKKIRRHKRGPKITEIQ